MNGQGKIRLFVADLARVLYLNAIKLNDPIVAKESEKVYELLSSAADVEDSGKMMSILNDVEISLREILTVLYQKVFGRSIPTKLLYFSGLSVVVHQGEQQISYECIGYRKILLLFIVIATVFAFSRTRDTDLLKIFDVLHKITFTSLPKDRSDIYGNAFLVKVATTLFMAAPENIDTVKAEVFKLLNITLR